MSALDDLQAAAHAMKDGLDSSLAGAADLEKNTDDLAQQFAGLGNDEIAAVLSQGASGRMATVREQLANAQQELENFISDCEQAKGSGGG